MKNKLIISAFHVVGKTYLYNKFKEKGYSISDSDSSKFSKGDEFPKNYLDHIKNIDSNLVLVSTHELVVDGILNDPELSKNYWIVAPKMGIKDEIINRMIGRGSSTALIEIVENNYQKWIQDLIAKSKKLLVLDSNEYLSDLVTVDCHGNFKIDY